MIYGDTLQDHITDLYLQVQDLKKRSIKADEAIRDLERRIDALERRIEQIERKLNHKGGNE